MTSSSLEEWTVKRLKYVASYNDEVLSERTDEFAEIDYVEIGDVSLVNGIETVNRMDFGAAPSRARRVVRSGDILVSTVRTYLKAIAAVKCAPEDLVASTGFCVVRPSEEVDSGFIGWVCKSDPFVHEVVARSVGVSYPAINASELVTIRAPIPPLEIQKKIASFLDEKTARIDALIACKRALLERLAEKRQAMITAAVTKGLDPTVPLKPSGVPWLGDIPAHWEVCGLGQKIKLQRGVDLTNDQRVEGDVPVISSGGVEYFHDTAICSAPGVLIGRKGSAGKLHYVESPYWPHDTTLYVREFRDNFPRFVWYVFQCLDLTSFDTGSANPSVNRNRVHPMKTPWPLVEEQIKVASWLDTELRKIEQVERDMQRSVYCLSEYRSALVTAAVAGQIAVR